MVTSPMHPVPGAGMRGHFREVRVSLIDALMAEHTWLILTGKTHSA
jgi:hypothetical protein